MKHPRGIAIPLLLCCACLLSPATATASTLVLLDHSGSMLGSSDREARKAITESFLPRIDPGETVLFWAFGGGCRSIRHQGRPGTPDDARRQVEALGVPVGGTPLGYSVLRSLDELKTLPEPRHLVVVTDGEDTCGVDPCEEVRRARAGGTEVSVHTVGLDMSRWGRDFAMLRCMAAESSGGSAQVLESGNGGSALEEALKSIAESLEEPTGELWVELVDAEGKPRSGIAYRAESLADARTYEGLSGEGLDLPEGRYRVVVGNREGVVVLRKGRPSRLEVASPLGRLELRAGCAEGLSYTLADGSGAIVDTGVVDDDHSMDLAPGVYVASLNGFPLLSEQRVQVVRNRSRVVDLGQFGRLRVEGRDPEGGELDLPLEIYDDSGAGQGVLATGEANREFKVPAGDYNVRVAADDPRASHFVGGDNVRVAACETRRVELQQRAILRVCGTSGAVHVWNDTTGEHTQGEAGKDLGLRPGVYNLKLPDGRRIDNLRVERGLNPVGCEAEG